MNSYRKYRISVTQSDIDAGARRDCEYCPVARAASRVFNADCSVYLEQLTYRFEGLLRVYAFSGAVGNRIVKFDQFGIMKPFSFVVRGA